MITPKFGYISADIMEDWKAEYGEEDLNELEDNDEWSAAEANEGNASSGFSS